MKVRKGEKGTYLYMTFGGHIAIGKITFLETRDIYDPEDYVKVRVDKVIFQNTSINILETDKDWINLQTKNVYKQMKEDDKNIEHKIIPFLFTVSPKRGK